eukprot:1840205-Prymnesium_polylepis.3
MSSKRWYCGCARRRRAAEWLTSRLGMLRARNPTCLRLFHRTAFLTHGLLACAARVAQNGLPAGERATSSGCTSAQSRLLAGRAPLKRRRSNASGGRDARLSFTARVSVCS